MPEPETVRDFDGNILLVGETPATQGGDVIKRVVSAPYDETVTPNAYTTDVLRIGALTGNITIATPSGAPTDCQRLEIELLQDGDGGHTLYLDSGIIFPASSNLSSPISNAFFIAPNALTCLVFTYCATRSKWLFRSFEAGF